MKLARLVINKVLSVLGLTLVRKSRIDSLLPYFSQRFEGEDALNFAVARSMQNRDSLYNLWLAGSYCAANNLEGAFVECGVWRGASMQLLAHNLIHNDDQDRELYLFDTYQGMTPPSDADVRIKDSRPADELGWQIQDLPNEIAYLAGVPAFATLEDVKSGFENIDISNNRIHLIVGDVLTTIPKYAPEKICILRIDTDWFESTKYSLEHLYPRLTVGGVLILDDYDYWSGARRAVNEYFKSIGTEPFLFHQGGGGRIYLKQH